MFRHIFLLILTILLGIAYIVTLDFSKFQFIDAIIMFMLLFSAVFNVITIMAKRDIDKHS